MPVRLNSSGGGSVTLDVPATAGTFTATVPANTGTLVTTGSTAAVTQGMLASGVAGNGPAFLVTLGSVQTISINTWTKITLNTELFDTNSNFDSTTNHRFRPTIAGYYQFNAQVSFIGSGINAFIAIYKNGNLTVQGSTTPTGAGASGQILNLAVLLDANGTTDFFELYGYSGGTQINSSLSNTNFSGFLARAA